MTPPDPADDTPATREDRLRDLQARITEVESREPESVETPEFVEDEAPERSERAHNIGMHALTRRGVSVNEMRDLLQRRGLEHDDAELEIYELQRVGLLDDAALAENLVDRLTRRKGLGRAAVAAELRRRKIASETVEAALELLDGQDEYEKALELARKRATQLRGLDDDTARRRLSGFLLRKGYGQGVVLSVVDAALRGPGPRTASGPRFE